MISELEQFLSWPKQIEDSKRRYKEKFGDAEWLRPFENELLDRLEALTIKEQESRIIVWLEDAVSKLAPKTIRNRVGVDYIEKLSKTATIPSIRNTAFRITVSASRIANPKENDKSSPTMLLTDSLQLRPSYFALQSWGMRFRTDFVHAFSESSLERSSGIVAFDRFKPRFDELLKEFYAIVCDGISASYNDAVLLEHEEKSIIHIRPLDIGCYSCRNNLEDRDFIVLHSPVKRRTMPMLGGNHVWPRKRSLGQKYPTLPFHSLCRHLYENREDH